METKESSADLAVLMIFKVLQNNIVAMAPIQNERKVALKTSNTKNPINAPRKLALILLDTNARDFSLMGDITTGM